MNYQPKISELSRSFQYKAGVKRAVKRTDWYVARALERSNEVINESLYSAASYAGQQVKTAREV